MTEDAIRPFYAMEILSRAQAMETQGREVCHLEIGEPARSPAPRVIETVRQGLCEPQRYTAAKGSRALRERLAGHYQDRHGVRIDPERIIVTMGSSSGFILSFLAGFEARCADRGDAAGLSGLSQYHRLAAPWRSGDSA